MCFRKAASCAPAARSWRSSWRKRATRSTRKRWRDDFVVVTFRTVCLAILRDGRFAASSGRGRWLWHQPGTRPHGEERGKAARLEPWPQTRMHRGPRRWRAELVGVVIAEIRPIKTAAELALAAEWQTAKSALPGLGTLREAAIK